MDLYEVVTKLVGPIQPVGKTNEDQQRLENLKVLINLVDRLLFDIDGIAPAMHRPEASMKALGELARSFMNDVHNNY